MQARTVLIIAGLVLLILVAAYALTKDPGWAQRSYWAANFTDTPRDLYGRSDGSFDRAAQAALRRATTRETPTTADRTLAAEIITQTVINRENPLEVRADGTPTPAAVGRTRERRRLFDDARGQLAGAIDGLAQRRRLGAPLDAHDGEVETMLDAAIGFAFGGAAAFIANDPLLRLTVANDFGMNAGNDWFADHRDGMMIGGNMLFHDIHEELAFFPGIGIDAMPFIDRPLADSAGRLRGDIIADRRRTAAGMAGGARGAAADAYVELATQHVNDSQNVHDPSVLACQKAIVDRLRAEGPADSGLPTIDAIISELKAEGPEMSRGVAGAPVRAGRVKRAIEAAERTKRGERVVAVGATDEECLRRVWQRANDPRNAANRGKMRTAVFDGLVDSWEPGLAGDQIMCVNGRTSHILGALAMLDSDPRNWAVERLEHFKNAIFERSKTVIEDEARRAISSGDAALGGAGRLYLAKTAAEINAAGEVPDEATERLQKTMRDAISEMVDNYVANLDSNLGATAVVPPYMIASIKQEAMAAVQ